MSTAAQQAEAHKGRLTTALANLAQMDEQRERLVEEIAALRNYLNGYSLGQRAAAEQQQREQAARVPAEGAPDYAAESYGGTD